MTVHPLAVKGMLGAIVGMDYTALYDYTKNMRVGIQVLSPVYKDMQSFNLIAMSNNNGAANSQSRIQFLRDVKYRLFVSDEGDKLRKLAEVLNSRQYIFTPYLGCSEHVARLDFEGIFESMPAWDENVDTLIPKEFVCIEGNKDFNIYLDRIPIKNTREREYAEYSNIAFTTGTRLKISGCEIYKVGEYNVFFF
jgi:CRISPR-associated protein Cas5h